MRILLAICIVLLLSALPTAAVAESVLLVTNEYDPYVIVGGDKKGFLYEVVVAAFDAVGIEVEIQYRPWRRCAFMVEEGSAVGAFPYAKTPKREKYAWFSNSIGECRNAFFFYKSRMDSFTFTGLDSLRPYSLAGTSGHFYEEVFEQAGLPVDYAPGEASGVHKVRHMRVDLFAEDEMVGWNLINRIFPEKKDLFGSSEPWNVNPQHVMISKRYPSSRRYMKLFNWGLSTIRNNGVYDRIRSRYSFR